VTYGHPMQPPRCWPWKAPLVSGRRLLPPLAAVLVLGAVGTSLGADAALGAQVRRAYRLEVELTQSYEQQVRAPSAGLDFRARTETQVATDAVPVWLVRRGRRSARSYAVRVRGGGGGGLVRAQGPVVFSGSGREDIITSLGSCLSTLTYALTGASTATVDLVLRHMRIEQLRIRAAGAVNVHDETSCSNGMQDTRDIPWGYGPVSSPASVASAALTPSLGAVARTSFRFGRAFSIVLHHDPSNDPSLSTMQPEQVTGATNAEQWRYTWRLEMTPAVKRHRAAIGETFYS